MLYLQVLYQRLNRDCSFREIFAERALMRTIVQFFFAKPAFGNPPGGHSDPVFIRSGNFSDEKDDLRKRTFRTISKRLPPPGRFAAAGPGPTPAKRTPTKSPGEENPDGEARRLPDPVSGPGPTPAKRCPTKKPGASPGTSPFPFPPPIPPPIPPPGRLRPARRIRAGTKKPASPTMPDPISSLSGRNYA